MDFSIRTATPAEQMYSYSQSSQIEGQTGCIGHLRADFDSDGNSFYSSWADHNASLKDQAFKDEFDHVFLDHIPGMYARIPSLVLLEQIHTLDKSRLLGYIGSLSDSQMKQVNTALKCSLELWQPSWAEATCPALYIDF